MERLDPVDALAGELRPERLGVRLGARVQVGRARWPGPRTPGPAGRSGPRRGGSRSRATGSARRSRWHLRGSAGRTVCGRRPGHPTARARAPAAGRRCHHPCGVTQRRTRGRGAAMVADQATDRRPQPGVEPWPDDDEPKHLFVLGFPDRAAADAAVAELTELQRDQFLEVKDYAIVSKGDGRRADRRREQGRRSGRPPRRGDRWPRRRVHRPGRRRRSALGAILAGVGIGAVAGALRDSGFKNKDLEEVGALMQDGRTLLLLAVRPRGHGAPARRPRRDPRAQGRRPALGGRRRRRTRRTCCTTRSRSTRPSRPERRTRAPSAPSGPAVSRCRRPARPGSDRRRGPRAGVRRRARSGPGTGRRAAAAGSRCRWPARAASSRLRNSPPAAHCSVARTRAQDLEGHAVLAEGLDPLDPRRLEDAALPLGLAGHRRARPRRPRPMARSMSVP